MAKEKHKFDRFDIEMLETDVTICGLDVLLRRIASVMGATHVRIEPKSMNAPGMVWRASASFWAHDGKTPSAAVRKLARWVQRYIKNPDIASERPKR